jgi:hypothetical protein
MPKAAADLSQFTVKKRAVPAAVPASREEAHREREPKLITKGFRVSREAAHQFNMLCAEMGKDDPKNAGPRLIAEALNDLFKKYGKPPIA